MALKISLKPGERLLIGGAAITNGATRCDLIIENDVPLLREKEILSAEDADSPCKRIYLAVQLMYMDSMDRLAEHHRVYWELVRDVVNAAPSSIGLIDEISDHILCGRYYQALKTAKRLIEYEQEVLQNVHSTARSL